MIHKLDNPQRIEELNPPMTLARIGLKSTDTICDIGAGTGIFTFAAAEMTEGKVYAVDISSDMREILKERNQFEQVKILYEITKVPDHSCQIVLLCTVLHELKEVSQMASEINRILTEDGRLAIIEFIKAKTPMGPPPERRLSEADVSEMLSCEGFSSFEHYDLGENLYCTLFKKVG